MQENEMLVVIVDALSLRRNAYASLLEGWATANEFTIAQVPDTKSLTTSLMSNCALTLVVLGSHLVGSAEGKSRLQSAMRETEGPVAAIVERQTADCVAAALDLKLKGVLLVSEAPSVIFAALGFMVAGGCYIPHVRSTTVPQSERSYLPAPIEISPQSGRAEQRPAEMDGLEICGKSDLTRRQHDVLRFLANGDSNKEIARELDLSEATVKSHVRQVMIKLNAGNRTQAALVARDLFFASTNPTVGAATLRR